MLRVLRSRKKIFIVVSLVLVGLVQGPCDYRPDPAAEANFLPMLTDQTPVSSSVVDRARIESQVRRIHAECDHESKRS